MLVCKPHSQRMYTYGCSQTYTLYTVRCTLYTVHCTLTYPIPAPCPSFFQGSRRTFYGPANLRPRRQPRHVGHGRNSLHHGHRGGSRGSGTVAVATAARRTVGSRRRASRIDRRGVQEVQRDVRRQCVPSRAAGLNVGECARVCDVGECVYIPCHLLLERCSRACSLRPPSIVVQQRSPPHTSASSSAPYYTSLHQPPPPPSFSLLPGTSKNY